MDKQTSAAKAVEVIDLGGGLATTALAELHGLNRVQLSRLAQAGVLERVSHGIYALAGASDPQQHLRAAWLALEPAALPEQRLRDPIPTGILSHTSAAALHNLGDLLDDVPELTVPSRKQSRRGIRLHRADLTPRDVMISGSLPVTTPERTVTDLLRAGHDEGHVVDIVRAGVEHGLIEHSELARQLDAIAPRQGEPDGAHLAERLLDQAGLSARALTAAVGATPIGEAIRMSTIQNLMGALPPSVSEEVLRTLANLAGTTAFHNEATSRAMMAALPDSAPLNDSTLAALSAALPPMPFPTPDLSWLAPQSNSSAATQAAAAAIAHFAAHPTPQKIHKATKTGEAS